MSRKRLGRLQRAATIVPLALLSAAWTASVAGIGGITPPVSASQGPDGSLPDGTSVPTEAIEAPASVSDPDDLSTDGNTQNIVATASTNQIPSAALAAYQRAEAVINKADKSCNLTWQLVAVIGRVESNHGRFGGNVLDDDGVAQPGIYGVALNGRKSTKAISDTDGGQFDNDTQWDRAVGPMQFIPSTWSVVGVDADGDGVRNPQDVDDAALGTAVYLCSGSDDLATEAGRQAAVYRYNHSQSYVDLVLAIMEAYTLGDFTAVPNSTVAAGYLVRDPDPVGGGNGQGDQQIKNPPQQDDDEPEPTEPADDPTEAPPPTGGGGGGGGAGGGGGTTPTPTPTLPPADVPDLPTTGVPPVDEVLTHAEATAQCIADGISQLDVAAFAACLDGYMNP